MENNIPEIKSAEPVSDSTGATFIYALCDPDDGTVRYIGKSDNPKERYGNHLRGKEKTYKTNWINKLKQQGKTPILQIIQKINKNSWEEKEIKWIAYYREIYGDKLTNTNKGGAGSYIAEKKTLEKLSSVHKGRHHSEETKRIISQKNMGHIVSEKTRKKISEANKGNLGHIPSPEELKAASERIKKRMAIPQERMKTSERSKRQWDVPGAKEKFSEFNRKRWTDPEFRKNFSKKMKKQWDDSEKRKKMSETTKNLYDSDPEYRKKLYDSWNPERRREMSERSKLLWSTSRDIMLESRNSPGGKKLRSERSKAMWSDPKMREKIITRVNTSPKNTERINKLKERNKTMWADPMMREKILKALNEGKKIYQEKTKKG